MKTLAIIWFGAASVVLLCGLYSYAIDLELEALGLGESEGTLPLILVGVGMLTLGFGWAFSSHQRDIREWRASHLPEDDIDDFDF
jgi:hypothetical protein